MKSSMCQNQSSRLCWKSGIVSHSAYGHFSKLEVQFWTFRYFGEALCGNCRTYIGTKTTHLDDAIFLFSFSVTWAIFHVY
ncbi:hypothetical protein HanXRQr2_Chr08g0330381 [Helianthus annuus]|uniref:Uncharacterized protein n=1 Tax=Helianthus annuus TaxID=4232 RepID=A0A9K3ID89_HELAN|nr:hypothetical protein HanXRQr2_Chr08g0330381 [Helianthus annuus]